jgi:type II secretory pathway pseudopilin PulG
MKNQKGFTIIEILVAATISVAAGALLFSILINTTGVFYQQTSKVNQGVGGNDAQVEFRKYLKEAQSVVAAYPESGSPLYSTGSSQVVLKLAAINQSGSVINGVSDYAVFYLTGSKLKERIFPNVASARPATDKILVDNVQTVLFQYFDSSGAIVSPPATEKAKMTLKLSQKAGAGIVTNTATAEANLRND